MAAYFCLWNYFHIFIFAINFTLRRLCHLCCCFFRDVPFIMILVTYILVSVISVYQGQFHDCIQFVNSCALSHFLPQRNWRPWARWRWIDWPASANHFRGIWVGRERWCRSAFWAPSDVCQVIYQLSVIHSTNCRGFIKVWVLGKLVVRLPSDSLQHMFSGLVWLELECKILNE